MKKLLIVFALLLVSNALAATDQISIGMGLNYSSIQLRYLISPVLEFQLRNDNNIVYCGASLCNTFYVYKTASFRVGSSLYPVSSLGSLLVVFMHAEWMITDKIGLVPEYDLLYEQQSIETDPSQRQTLVWKMQDILLQDLPYIVLFDSQVSIAVRTDRYKGWPFNKKSLMLQQPDLLAGLEPISNNQ